MNYLLRTERLNLRLMNVKDADALFHLHCDDPEAMRFVSWRPEDLAEAMRDMFKIRQQIQNGESILWIIEPKEHPKLIGLLHLADIHHGEGEVHFVIAKACWGEGLVVEALGAVLGFARNTLRLYRIRGYCEIDNSQSASVFKKSKFQYLGNGPKQILQRNGAYEARECNLFEIDL